VPQVKNWRETALTDKTELGKPPLTLGPELKLTAQNFLFSLSLLSGYGLNLHIIYMMYPYGVHIVIVSHAGERRM